MGRPLTPCLHARRSGGVHRCCTMHLLARASLQVVTTNKSRGRLLACTTGSFWWRSTPEPTSRSAHRQVQQHERRAQHEEGMCRSLRSAGKSLPCFWRPCRAPMHGRSLMYQAENHGNVPHAAALTSDVVAQLFEHRQNRFRWHRVHPG